MKIEIKILNKAFYSDLPKYQTAGSAAIDLCCTEDVKIYPGQTKTINTGLAIWIGSNKLPLGIDHQYDAVMASRGVAGLILPRSGLGTKGLILANTIGLIDSDYQGELKITAWNRKSPIMGHDYPDTIELKAGDRIAQLMFVPIIKAQWNIVEEFSNKTDRADGGFGSTGE